MHFCREVIQWPEKDQDCPGNECLTSLALLHLHRDIDISLPDVIDAFARRHPHRLSTFLPISSLLLCHWKKSLIIVPNKETVQIASKSTLQFFFAGRGPPDPPRGCTSCTHTDSEPPFPKSCLRH